MLGSKFWFQKPTSERLWITWGGKALIVHFLWYPSQGYPETKPSATSNHNSTMAVRFPLHRPHPCSTGQCPGPSCPPHLLPNCCLNYLCLKPAVWRQYSLQSHSLVSRNPKLPKLDHTPFKAISQWPPQVLALLFPIPLHTAFRLITI